MEISKMSSTSDAVSFKIRPAAENDIAQVRDIFSFYVLNTTISFMLDDPPLDYMIKRFRSTTERKLPYFVAADEAAERVLGFCHASPFSSDKGGYATAVDFSLFVRPEQTGMGIGSALLNALIEHLRENPYLCWEQDEAKKFAVRARQLYAVTSADIASNLRWTAKGQANWEWYGRKFGFREVGRLPGIGSKFGQR